VIVTVPKGWSAESVMVIVIAKMKIKDYRIGKKLSVTAQKKSPKLKRIGRDFFFSLIRMFLYLKKKSGN
jgi:hypothetical protein